MTSTAVREERRLVTCMFVDLVGSTDLTMRLGAERLKRELGTAFTELSGIVAAHGGTVEKYVGDAIYALFGAPVAHEDDALRALRAAEAIREWCVGRGGEHGHPFMVRIGVETGEAVIDLEAAATTRQQMSVGPVVNTAARLQQRADPGEVLVGPATREAAGDAAELEPLDDVELKGIGALKVWRLVRVGMTQRPALPFVGRDAELALLAHAHQRAAKGRSVLAVVSGPPGQGKTRLVQEFLRDRAAGAHVIATRCRPPDETGVFAPVREILGVTTIDALAEQVGRLCTDDVECERVVAGLAESAGIAATRGSLAQLPAAEREDEVVNAWRRYLGILGAERLVILAVDDVHWADASLVRLIDRLTFGGPRLLVVATARPEFSEAAGIRPSGDRFFIELEGLEPEEARRLAGLAGREDDRVVERAEGNPLFLVELARGSRDGDLPLTLQGALGARLDQVPAADRGLLSLAAVAGERFTVDDAAFLAGRDLAETGRTLTRLVDLHFLDLSEKGSYVPAQPGGAGRSDDAEHRGTTYRFHHGLVRDVAYGRLLAAERMKAHARFARGRAHPEDAETLAYHWWEALRPPDAEWIWAGEADLPAMRREAHAALLAAGIRHGEHFLPERAVELLERALSFADDDQARAAVERALGNAYTRVLRQDEAWAHMTRALELHRAAGEVPLEVYMDVIRAAQWTGAFVKPPGDEEVEELVERGSAIARSRNDLAALSAILRNHAQFLVNKYTDDAARAEPIVDAAIEAAEASGAKAARRAAYFTKYLILRRAGRLDEADRFLEEVGRLTDDADAMERLSYLRAKSAQEFHRADLATCDATSRSALALSEPMGGHNRTHAIGDLIDLLRARGAWDEVVELAHATARIVAEAKGSAFCDSAATAIRDGAIAHALRGEREEAQALLRVMPTTDIEVDLMSSVPRAILGFPSPDTDAKLAEDRWGWWEWQNEAFREVILRRPEAAERALEKMGRVAESSVVLRAFAAAVREAVQELRGGPPATFRSLRDLGLDGWIEVLKRRVDAEY